MSDSLGMLAVLPYLRTCSEISLRHCITISQPKHPQKVAANNLKKAILKKM